MTRGKSEIRVRVVDYNREHLMLRWIDPTTGKRRTISSGCKKVREAHFKADQLEKELNAKQPTGNGSLPWSYFVDMYTDDHLESLAVTSMNRSLGILRVFEREISPQTLGDVTGSVLSAYCSKLRKNRSEATIATHMRTIMAAMKWAVSNGHLTTLPQFPKQARAKGSKAKGRPLTDKEFVKLLRAVRLQEDLARLDRSDRRAWRRLLIGLWLSGLRLDEALRLRWNDGTFFVDTDGKFPLFVIREQKSGQEQTIPLTPDFGHWLLKTPTDKRTGFVFNVAKERHHDKRRMDTTSKTISAIGEKSGVKVSAKKFASAHDLRRSFGLRWSSKVMPAELQALMRHSDISTTMSYYAIVSAQSFAEKLWKDSKTATESATGPEENP